MARLTMRRGPTTGTIYELTKDIVNIGRGTKNDIVIDHPDLSRNHCQLVRLVTDYELQDLNSTNGTFIDGQRLIANRILHSGSLIELGDAVTFEYQVDQQSVSDAPPPPIPEIKSQTAVNPDQPFFLVIKLGKEADRVYLLRNDQVTIGRDLSNDVVIQDPEVSRWHVQLQRSPEGYTAKDMGSTNGTLLNGVRMNAPKPLTELDTLELGTSARLSYVREISDAANNESSKLPTNDLSKSKNKTAIGPLIEQRKTTELNIDYKGDADPTNSNRSDILNLSSRKQTSRLGTGIIQGSLVNHIFLAYMREDWEDLVAPLTVILQDAGMSVWVDQYLTQGGVDWTAAIEQALHECWLMVVIASPESLESRYVKLEYRYFINREKPVIPFLYKPTEKMPPELNNHEIIRYDRENSKRSFQRLILEILHKRSK